MSFSPSVPWQPIKFHYYAIYLTIQMTQIMPRIFLMMLVDQVSKDDQNKTVISQRFPVPTSASVLEIHINKQTIKT